MNCYKAFLSMLEQLNSQSHAKIEVEGTDIFIKVLPGNNNWNLSSKILKNVEKSQLKEFKDCFSPSGELHTTSNGAYLKFESEIKTLFLMENVKKQISIYIFFKRCILRFLDSIKEWNEIIT